MANQKDPKKLEIAVDDEVAYGVYTNLALVNHSSDEFTLDFVYVPPSSPKAKLRARVISSPSHTKRFLLALQENIKRYEEKFGEIEITQHTTNKYPDGVGNA